MVYHWNFGTDEHAHCTSDEPHSATALKKTALAKEASNEHKFIYP